MKVLIFYVTLVLNVHFNRVGAVREFQLILSGVEQALPLCVFTSLTIREGRAEAQLRSSRVQVYSRIIYKLGNYPKLP